MRIYDLKAIRRMALLAWLLPGTSWAVINPNFTPVHLVEQTDTILELSFDGVDDEGMIRAVVEDTLKGKKGAYKGFRIDPSAAISEAPGKDLSRAALAEGRRALLFIGSFKAPGIEGDGLNLTVGGENEPRAVGFLHINGLPVDHWVVLENWDEGVWDLVENTSFLLATFNGGTPMLKRMIRYILSDPEADVPVHAGVRWVEPPLEAGRVDHPVRSAQAVFLGGVDDPYREDVFLAAPRGDRLLRWRDGALVDVTEELGLNSKSELVAWGDFTDSGRLSLLSVNGADWTLHERDASGRFQARTLPAGDGAPKVLSLQAVSMAEGLPGLLAGTSEGAWLGSLRDGALTWRPLTEPEPGWTPPGGLTACVAADFTGDGLVDVLQPGTASGLLYRGTGPGVFAVPETVPVAVGEGGHGVTVADFDQDGLPDLFVASERRHRLWQNHGDGRFEEVMGRSGEVSYKHTDRGNAALAEDFNNDGRQDLLISFNAPRAPYILYNRGFRSFAAALTLDLDRPGLVPAAAEGQQALTFADVNGDGAQDLVLVLPNGDIRCVMREVEGPAALKLHALLPAGEAGPVTVTGRRFERSLGARLAGAGSPAGFGVRDPGPVKLRWRYPGGEERNREVILEDGPVTIILER